MSLLLRVSIVFVALVYLGQLRRKQQYIRNTNQFWLSPNDIFSHPALRTSRMSPTQTAHFIREFLASSTNQNKTDEELMREYQDHPPNYEEALRCPAPVVDQRQTQPSTLASATMQPMTSRASQVTLGPPTFDDFISNLPTQTLVSLSKQATNDLNVTSTNSATPRRQSSWGVLQFIKCDISF